MFMSLIHLPSPTIAARRPRTFKMGSPRKWLAAAFVALATLLVPESKGINFNVSADTYDPTAFGGKGGWPSGSITLPPGTAIGATPLNLNLFLSHDLVLTDSEGTGSESLGFGMGGLNPAAAPGEVLYTFAISLGKDGTILTPGFGFSQANPFPFSVNNLGVGFGASITRSSLVFNEVHIQVTCPVARTVGDFNTTVGVRQQVNHAPVALADSFIVDAGSVLSVPGKGVLANDYDSDGQPLSAVLLGGTAHGALILGSSGNFAYTPAPGFQGSDEFIYQASDGALSSQPATVKITVAPPLV